MDVVEISEKERQKVENILLSMQFSRDLLELRQMNGARCANRQRNCYGRAAYAEGIRQGGKRGRLRRES